MYPEHFLNERQLEKQRQGKLRYMPGPANVIEVPLHGSDDVFEVPLNIGFVGRKEQTGHPAQKPEKVFEQLVSMTTQEGDIVLDPFCGGGTTGAVCVKMGRRTIMADLSEEYTQFVEKRLETKRQPSDSLKNFFRNSKTSSLSDLEAACTIA
jgi:site-specific DNA-methyltransferase (adenine-specific)